MFSLLSHGIVLVITICYLIVHVNAQLQNGNGSDASDGNANRDLANIDAPSIPIHNDTSRDNEGVDHDSEPMRGNGRGTYEIMLRKQMQQHGIPFEDFQQIVLNQHNIYRREMCANDLESDENLHRIAEQRVHNKANGKELPLPDDYNENVYIHDTGDPSKITGEMIVKFWYDQRQKYDINNESSATDFTQLVWKNSNKIGVGHAYNGHKLYVIVLYKPSGNIRGQFTANVGCNSNGQSNQSNR